MAEITINDYVWVKLSDHGRQIVRANKDALEESIGRRMKFPMPEERDGWSQWQLWSFIGEFGDHSGGGGRVYVDAFTTECPPEWRSVHPANAQSKPDLSAITRAVSAQ